VKRDLRDIGQRMFLGMFKIGKKQSHRR